MFQVESKLRTHVKALRPARVGGGWGTEGRSSGETENQGTKGLDQCLVAKERRVQY